MEPSTVAPRLSALAAECLFANETRHDAAAASHGRGLGKMDAALLRYPSSCAAAFLPVGAAPSGAEPPANDDNPNTTTAAALTNSSAAAAAEVFSVKLKERHQLKVRDLPIGARSILVWRRTLTSPTSGSAAMRPRLHVAAEDEEGEGENEEVKEEGVGGDSGGTPPEAEDCRLLLRGLNKFADVDEVGLEWLSELLGASSPPGFVCAPTFASDQPSHQSSLLRTISARQLSSMGCDAAGSDSAAASLPTSPLPSHVAYTVRSVAVQRKLGGFIVGLFSFDGERVGVMTKHALEGTHAGWARELLMKMLSKHAAAKGGGLSEESLGNNDNAQPPSPASDHAALLTAAEAERRLAKFLQASGLIAMCECIDLARDNTHPMAEATAFDQQLVAFALQRRGDVCEKAVPAGVAATVLARFGIPFVPQEVVAIPPHNKKSDDNDDASAGRAPAVGHCGAPILRAMAECAAWATAHEGFVVVLELAKVNTNGPSCSSSASCSPSQCVCLAVGDEGGEEEEGADGSLCICKGVSFLIRPLRLKLKTVRYKVARLVRSYLRGEMAPLTTSLAAQPALFQGFVEWYLSDGDGGASRREWCGTNLTAATVGSGGDGEQWREAFRAFCREGVATWGRRGSLCDGADEEEEKAYTSSFAALIKATRAQLMPPLWLITSPTDASAEQPLLLSPPPPPLTVVIMCGVPGSGKSTTAKALRKALEKICKRGSGEKERRGKRERVGDGEEEACGEAGGGKESRRRSEKDNCGEGAADVAKTEADIDKTEKAGKNSDEKKKEKKQSDADSPPPFIFEAIERDALVAAALEEERANVGIDGAAPRSANRTARSAQRRAHRRLEHLVKARAMALLAEAALGGSKGERSFLTSQQLESSEGGSSSPSANVSAPLPRAAVLVLDACNATSASRAHWRALLPKTPSVRAATVFLKVSPQVAAVRAMAREGHLTLGNTDASTVTNAIYKISKVLEVVENKKGGGQNRNDPFKGSVDTAVAAGEERIVVVDAAPSPKAAAETIVKALGLNAASLSTTCTNGDACATSGEGQQIASVADERLFVPCCWPADAFDALSVRFDASLLSLAEAALLRSLDAAPHGDEAEDECSPEQTCAAGKATSTSVTNNNKKNKRHQQQVELLLKLASRRRRVAPLLCTAGDFGDDAFRSLQSAAFGALAALAMSASSSAGGGKEGGEEKGSAATNGIFSEANLRITAGHARWLPALFDSKALRALLSADSSRQSPSPPLHRKIHAATPNAAHCTLVYAHPPRPADFLGTASPSTASTSLVSALAAFETSADAVPIAFADAVADRGLLVPHVDDNGANRRRIVRLVIDAIVADQQCVALRVARAEVLSALHDPLHSTSATLQNSTMEPKPKPRSSATVDGEEAKAPLTLALAADGGDDGQLGLHNACGEGAAGASCAAPATSSALTAGATLRPAAKGEAAGAAAVVETHTPLHVTIALREGADPFHAAALCANVTDDEEKEEGGGASNPSRRHNNFVCVELGVPIELVGSVTLA